MSTDKPKSPYSLGAKIRSRRLRWNHSARRHAWVRIADLGPGLWRIELAPDEKLPPPHKGHLAYRIVDDGLDEMLDMIPTLAAVRKVKRYIVFNVGEHGEVKP